MTPTSSFGSSGLVPGVVAVCAWTLCATVAPVAAQSAGSVYAFGGPALVHQAGATGESSRTYVTAPGGSTAGWLIGTGVFVTRTVSAEVEFSSTGMMRAVEPSRYGMTFNEERRDRFIVLAARIRLPRIGAFGLEPVAGLAWTLPQAWSQVDRYRYWLSPQQVLEREPRQEHHLDRKLGATVGCDVRIGRGRVALLPTFRLSDTGVSHGYYASSDYRSEISAIYPGGYPRWSVRAGLALSVGF